MAALQCEICGGKLIGKPGGIFECDSCGVEYSTEWAKAKVQEIRGTVKIEGPVRVEGSITAENLMKRGHIALGDGEWKKADQYFDKVLDIEPENGDAYAGKLCAERYYRKLEDMARDLKFTTGSGYEKALHFADEELKSRLEAYADAARKLQKAKREESRRQAEEKRRRDEAERQRMIPILAEKRKALAPVAGLIAAGHGIVGLRADGTVLESRSHDYRDVANWRYIVAVAAGDHHVVGLCADGTVLAAAERDYYEFYSGAHIASHMSGWMDIVAVAAWGDRTVGLRKDGTVLVGCCHGSCLHFTPDAPDNRLDVSQWRDIAAVATCGDTIVGLRRDGTVQAVSFINYDIYKWPLLSDWKDVVAIAAGLNFLIGLRKDGTVLSAHWDGSPDVLLSDWREIVSIATNGVVTVGLRSDGTVLTTGGNPYYVSGISQWTDIVAITIDGYSIYGLRSDGTVQAINYLSGNGRSRTLPGWKLFDSIETLEQEREEGLERLRHQKKISDLKSERDSLQKELAEVKYVLFFLRDRDRERKIEFRLAQIEKELNNL